MAKMNDLCDPCIRENVDTTAIAYCFDCAEKLCEDCRVQHKKNKASNTHNVGDIKEALEDIPKLEVLKELIKCPNHPVTDVQFMCKDHDKLCCGECAILSHRSCDHILSVAEMAKTYKLGENKNAVQEKLYTFDLFVKSLHTHEVQQHSVIDTSKEMVRHKLAELKTKFEKAYEEIESKVLQLSNDAHAKLTERVVKQEKVISEAQVRIGITKDLLEIVSKCGSDIHSFLAGTKLENDSLQLENDLRSLQKSATSENIQLVEKTSADAIMESLKECFEIKMKASNKELPKYPEHRNYIERLATLKSEFKCERDQQITSFVRGCVVIDNDTVAVLDEEVSSIHLFDINQHNRVASYTCASQPCCIADVGDSMIAVAQGNILVLKSEGFKIYCITEIQTMAQPHGLSYIIEDKHLFVSSRDDGSITRFQLDGTLVRHIPVDISTEYVVRQLDCIAFNNKSKVCYISAFYLNKVIAIDLKGKLVFTYEHHDMKNPYNMAIDLDGNLYICCYGSHCIHQVNETGVFIRQILTSKDGLKHPFSICFNKTMDAFILTANDEDKQIKVYTFD